MIAAERDEYLDSLRRLQADFDNFRKSSLRQQTELLEHATEGLCVRLLPVLDALDLAMSHLRSQAETRTTPSRLSSRSTRFCETPSPARASSGSTPPGSPSTRPCMTPSATAGGPCAPAGTTRGRHVPGEKVAPSAGEPKHTSKPAKAAKAAATADGPTVAEVMRAGYKMKSKVIRPAMVLVGD